MDNQKPVMFTPALIGGTIAGALSGIALLNCLCCIWIIGGAMLAAYLLVKDSPVALSSGDGAIVGVFTGIVAAIVNVIVNALLQPFNMKIMLRIFEWLSEYMEEMPPGFEDLLGGQGLESSVPTFFIGLVISVIIFSALGALGGILGISLFGKKAAKKTQGISDVSENTSNRQP